MILLNNEEKKNLDKYTIRELNIPSILLMENAAHRVFDLIKKEGSLKDKILILTGKGNNGGDGFALSRILRINNYDVEIFMVYEPESKNTKKNYEVCKNYDIKIFNKMGNINLNEYDIIVDSVFGTGFKGKLDNHVENIFSICNEN